MYLNLLHRSVLNILTTYREHMKKSIYDAAEWKALREELIEDVEVNKEFNAIVERFLLIDGINPYKFRSNFLTLLYRGFVPPFDAYKNIKVTPSLALFSPKFDIPQGYAKWFVSAYPDVVWWMTYKVLAPTMDDDQTLQSVQAIFGKMEEGEMFDKDGKFKTDQLRSLIEAYINDTQQTLECII